MTHRQIQLVQESYPLIQEMGDAVTRLFYGRLFESSPQLRPMFHGPIDVQARKFSAMLEALVDALPDLERMTGPLQAMGSRHVGYGVKPEHYAQVSQALVWALSQALEHEATQEVRQAWQALFDRVTALMLTT